MGVTFESMERRMPKIEKCLCLLYTSQRKPEAPVKRPTEQILIG